MYLYEPYVFIIVISVVSSEYTEGSGHKLKHKKFHLLITKNLFTMSVIKHWKKLPRETDQTPSGNASEQLGQVVLALSRELVLYDL